MSKEEILKELEEINTINEKTDGHILKSTKKLTIVVSNLQIVGANGTSQDKKAIDPIADEVQRVIGDINKDVNDNVEIIRKKLDKLMKDVQALR